MTLLRADQMRAVTFFAEISAADKKISFYKKNSSKSKISYRFCISPQGLQEGLVSNQMGIVVPFGGLLNGFF
jgi:hypothetical protein